MSYDKYRNWPLPTDRFTFPPPALRVDTSQPPTLEEQVLADLLVATDEFDKMEILDSYGAWHARSYRALMVRAMTEILSNGLHAIVAPLLDAQLPRGSPIHRGRPLGQE